MIMKNWNVFFTKRICRSVKNMKKQSENFRAIIQKLQSMAEKDQAMREETEKNPHSWDVSIDHKNTEEMKKIIDEIGWPTISQVGEKGSSNAWLIVQHADHDLEFQKKCLGLMKALPEGEVDKINRAYLEDRVAVAEGKPQVYGTQFFKDSDGHMHPRPLFDVENIELRRKKVGLGSFREYKKRMQERFGQSSRDKILIIGISGTGKTFLAEKLSDFFKIPITHYDQLVWGECWQEVDEKIVEQKIKEVIKKDKWIIEGYIHPAAKIKLDKADIVIYLDYSGFQAMLGGIQRWWKYRGKKRPEMASGCIEKFDFNFLKIMWKRRERPEIEEAIKNFEDKVVRLKSRKETEIFLDELFKSK